MSERPSILAVIAVALLGRAFRDLARAYSRTPAARRIANLWHQDIIRVLGFPANKALDCLSSVLGKNVTGTLGRGVYGLVVTANDERRGEVAIKVVENNKSVASPRQEFDCQMYLADRGLALRPYTLEKVGGISMLTMEIGKQTLNSELNTATVEVARLLGERAALLLSRIHDSGYVHGDFHPGNIVRDSMGNWKCIDLGMSSRPLRGDIFALGVKYDIIQFLRGVAIDREERLFNVRNGKIFRLRKRTSLGMRVRHAKTTHPIFQAIYDVYSAATETILQYSERVHGFAPPTRPLSSKASKQRSEIFEMYTDIIEREHRKRLCSSAA